MKLLFTCSILFGMFTGFAQTFTEVVKAAAFDREAEDRLGYAVDISGNYAIIGAYADDFGAVDPNMGSAYIFEKTGIENWQFVQKISNSDQDDYDRFGYSVAINGNLAVIGAYAEDHDELDGASLSKAGSAYVFERGDDGTWTEMQKLVASDREAGDEFGWSVAIYDSTIVVGAHHEGHDVDGLDYEYHAGSIYVFDLAADGTWSQTQKLVSSDRADDHVYPNGRPDPDDEDLSDLFGGSVAIWGDYIVAGAHNHDYGPGGVGTGFRWNQGAAYVFERTAGVWTEVTKLQSSVRKAWDRFGYALDIDSNLIVVGVYAEDESEFDAAPLMNAGGAYIFERDTDGDWNQIQKLDASDRTAGDHFGRDVSIDGNYLVVGAEHEDLFLGDGSAGDSLSNAGAGYVFEQDDDGVWSEIQKIVPEDRNPEDLFGESVAISEHTILAGAWQQDLDSAGATYVEDAGAAYFFSSVLCETVTTAQTISICAGDSLIVGSSVYNATGEYVDSLLNVDACDSIVTTTLTVIEPLYTEQDTTICLGFSVAVGDSLYVATGTYVDTLVAATGCDSIVTTNLTVIDPLITDQDLTICLGMSVTVGSSTYEATGTYIDTLFAISTGCDSIVTTNLTVIDPLYSEQVVSICLGDTFEVGANTYEASGTYIDTLYAISTGCDSIVTTELTVIDPLYSEQVVSICLGETFEVGESDYEASGTYIDTLYAISTGCDSIVTTELTVIDPLYSEQDLTICLGMSVTVGSNTYEATGTYIDTLYAISTGCDSIVTTELTVIDPLYSEQVVSICLGETFVVGESIYEATGTYIDTLFAISTGCDSIVTTELTVIDPLYSEQVVSICLGETFEVGESTYESSGTYIDTLFAISTGCDSIVTTALTVIEPLYSEQVISICSGTTFTIGTSTYDESGTYIDTLFAISTGCDSIVTTELTIEPAVTHEQAIYLCYGETYSIGTSTYDESGVYEDSLVTPEGCDSIVTTELFIEEENLTEQVFTICAGEMIVVGSSEYTETGLYSDTLVSATLCDSIVVTDLTVLPAIDVSIELDIIIMTAGDPDVETTTFQWYTCEPLTEIEGATERTYTPTENGLYAVIITDGECADTSECIEINSVGLPQYETPEFSVFPNPNTGQFTLTTQQTENTTVEVLNAVGAVIYKSPVYTTQTSVQLNNVAPGIYWVRLTNGSSSAVKRIIIQ